MFADGLWNLEELENFEKNAKDQGLGFYDDFWDGEHFEDMFEDADFEEYFEPDQPNFAWEDFDTDYAYPDEENDYWEGGETEFDWEAEEFGEMGELDDWEDYASDFGFGFSLQEIDFEE